MRERGDVPVFIAEVPAADPRARSRRQQKAVLVGVVQSLDLREMRPFLVPGTRLKRDDTAVGPLVDAADLGVDRVVVLSLIGWLR